MSNLAISGNAIGQQEGVETSERARMEEAERRQKVIRIVEGIKESQRKKKEKRDEKFRQCFYVRPPEEREQERRVAALTRDLTNNLDPVSW